MTGVDRGGRQMYALARKRLYSQRSGARSVCGDPTHTGGAVLIQPETTDPPMIFADQANSIVELNLRICGRRCRN